MKKIIGILFLSILTSCFDIDVQPKNSVTFENYFKTEKDIQTFMNTVKYRYRSAIVQSANFSIQIDKGYYADNIRDWFTEIGRDLDTEYIHSPNFSSCDWGSFYNVIGACNVFLENIDNVEFSQQRKDIYIGQAYFYRAHTYFWLAENWGDAVIEPHSRDTKAKAKSPYYEVLKQAIDDAKKALELLPSYKNLTDEDGKPTTSRQYLCKETAYSLLGYIYAWKASLNNEPDLYNLAIESLTEVLKQTENYDLAATPEDVCTKVLNGANHMESIFEVTKSWKDNPSMNQSTPAFFITSFPVAPTKKEGEISKTNAQISNASVDRMFPKGDLRRDAYFYKTDNYRDDASLVITGGWAFPYKFRYPLLVTSGTSIGKMTNLNEFRVMFRVADLLLLRAECYVRMGKDGEAITDLNRVRTRANATLYKVKSEPGDLRFTIFKEREKELLWESHRYFDVIRNEYYSEISQAYAKLTQQQIKDGAIYVPIGNAAFSDNPLMLQNKYWLSRY